jgi:hypothetical protein
VQGPFPLHETKIGSFSTLFENGWPYHQSPAPGDYTVTAKAADYDNFEQPNTAAKPGTNNDLDIGFIKM